MLVESTPKPCGRKGDGALWSDSMEQIGLTLDLDCYRHEPLVVPDHWLSPVNLAQFSEHPDDLPPEQRKDYCASLLGQAVIQYKAMRKHIARIAELVEKDGEQGFPARMLGDAPLEDSEARKRALYGIAQWTFEDGQDPNETPVFMGAIASSTLTIQAIDALNEMKETFSEIVKRLRLATDTQSNMRGDIYNLLNLVMEAEPKMIRSQMIGAMLRQVLHPRLNVRLLTRTIPVVNELPVSVRWRWHLFPSNRKLTRQQVLDLLEKKADKPFAQQDIQKLLTSCSDEFFAFKKKPQWDLRMHIKLPKAPGRKITSADFKTRLPLFYWKGEDGHYRTEPTMSLAPENSIQFKRRKKIATEPYLLTIPVHRYLTE